MVPGAFFSYNGKLVSRDAGGVISPANRSLRYGDGLFETMQVVNGSIVLESLHMNRLFKGLSLLQFNVSLFPSPRKLATIILRLCKANQLLDKAMVRLNVFRGNGGLDGLADQAPEYIIEVSPLPVKKEKRLGIGICYDAVKNAGAYSGIKSNNFLPYTIAALHAARNGWDDALVINQHYRIVETTISNLFCIRDGIVYTPALAEGCIEGVARKFLLTHLHSAGYTIREAPIEIAFLREAEEIFLTNVIRGIRSVHTFEYRHYSDTLTKRIHTWWQKSISGML